MTNPIDKLDNLHKELTDHSAINARIMFNKVMQEIWPAVSSFIQEGGVFGHRVHCAAVRITTIDSEVAKVVDLTACDCGLNKIVHAIREAIDD